MNEVQEYYAVKNNSCHTYTIETIDGGETWFVAATGNVHNEAWKAEAELENEMINRGYQVFYSITEAEDFLREMDRDTEGGLNLPQDDDDPQTILCQSLYPITWEDYDSQTEETSEQRIERYRKQLNQPCNETPEEKELLDTVERLILSPDECVYYNGTNYSFHKRSWQDVCLVDHYEDNMPCRVMDLGQWVRHDALDAIRSLHERLATV